uniref:Protein MKS1 n=1 Tax=Anthurium amnicola TaxID=1678845 RepID=A0A1D1Y2Z8_9ARAE
MEPCEESRNDLMQRLQSSMATSSSSLPKQYHHQQQQQPRAPVIIYTVSPKVIHTEPSNFMTLVQRLTGASPTTLSAARPPSEFGRPNCASPSGALSPAARFAAIERAQPSSDAGRPAVPRREDDIVAQLGIGGAAVASAAAALDWPAGFPGILSPLPSALPAISPNFFAPPPSDPASLAFLNEMSPIFRGNTGGGNSGFMEGPFLPSPGNFLSTPTFPSPGAYWEFLNQL